MFFPTFVELYCLDDYPLCIDALAFFTQYSSAEFAVRPLIEKQPEMMMAQMLKWASSDNEHIRRLASEGCRPRLPWASALPAFKQDPTLILLILEKLKDDKSEYVRRSVANNLNDISKDNPELVVELVKQWQGISKQCDWIIKHACRGLLKQAHPEALKLFGFSSVSHVSVTKLNVDKQVVMGDTLAFSFELSSKQALGKLRIEYAIDFMKKNGKQARKIFQISESTIQARQKQVSKNFSFKPISTRKYYLGKHQLAVIVNGVEKQVIEFKLT